MIHTSYYTSQNELLTIHPKPLGRGGEGVVYEVISPPKYKNTVIKVYHSKEQTPAREQKLAYMLANPLYQPSKPTLAWPKALIYKTSDCLDFVGYLMPKISDAIDLTQLCTPYVSDKIDKIWQYKFDRNTLIGLQNRLQVCKNIATAFAQIHQIQRYVFVDIKPENIKVNIEGEITVLDVDSVAVIAQERLLFPAQKASPEYSPAELKTQQLIPSDVMRETWDRFSLSVVFYKVLLGLHPFTGTCHPPFDKLDTYAQKIREGLFPMGQMNKHFRIIPLPHQAFYHLDAQIQYLFKTCFEEGYEKETLRPSAKQWEEAFQTVNVSKPLPALNPQTRKRQFKNSPKHYQQKNNLPAVIKSVLGGAALVAVAMLSTVQLGSYRLPDRPVRILKNPVYQEVISPKELARKYGFVNRFADGVAKVIQKGKYGYINENGDKIIDFKYEWADNFHEGAARVAFNQKFGAIDNQGKTIIPFQYDWIGRFQEGLARVILNGKTAYVNAKHQYLIDFEYDYGGDFENGMAAVRKDGYWGFINTQGTEVIKPTFVEVRNFYQGFAAAREGNQWGFINTRGEWAIAPQYEEVFSFIDGRAMVKQGAKQFEINHGGECIAFCPE